MKNFSKIMVAILVSVGSYAGFSASEAGSADVTPEIVKQLIESHLKQHPEIIVEAMEELNRRQTEEKSKQQIQSIANHQSELFNNPSTPVLGHPGGAIAVVTFMDYNCGHCRRSHDDLEKMAKGRTDMRVIVKDLPMLSKSSYQAAIAARAAHRQGKFPAFQKALMQSKERLGRSHLKEIAQLLGLDMERFEADTKDPQLLQQIDADIKLAEALGVDGTPTFIIGSKLIEGYPGPEEMMSLLLNRDAVAGSAVGEAVAQALSTQALSHTQNDGISDASSQSQVPVVAVPAFDPQNQSTAPLPSSDAPTVNASAEQPFALYVQPASEGAQDGVPEGVVVGQDAAGLPQGSGDAVLTAPPTNLIYPLPAQTYEASQQGAISSGQLADQPGNGSASLSVVPVPAPVAQ